MSAKERCVYAIVTFLKDELDASTDVEFKETVEVAKQCLETAYNIKLEEQRSSLDIRVPLANLINQIPAAKEITDEMKAEAEELKNQGNEAMKKDDFIGAVNSYTKALEIDPYNAVFYSNRAAAYNKLERFGEAIIDCEEAITLDPNYSKAYGRKGLALSGTRNHHEAIECYQKAIELDPNNQNFKNNLEIAQEKARTATAAPAGEAPGMAGMPGMGGLSGLLAGQGGGMPDIASLMGNPMMMQMAQQMMQNPQMQQMMSQMMSGFGGGQGGENGGEAPNLQNFMAAGAQMAQQMRQQNPDLVDQLQNQFNTGNPPPPNPDNNSSS